MSDPKTVLKGFDAAKLPRPHRRLIQDFLGRNGWLYQIDRDEYQLVNQKLWDDFKANAAIARLLFVGHP